MAEKSIREFSVPSSNNVPTGPEVQVGENFELEPGVIDMVQAIPFCGLATEDANSHLQQFLEICSTFTIKGASADAVKLRLFPFSLVEKAKQRFYLNRATLTTWDVCSNAFLAKYFPLGKTNALRNKISSFQQLADETVVEAWERLQEYIAACPHHGMEKWLIIQNFFHGLNHAAQEHLDAAAGGSFLSLSVKAAKELIEKMTTNQGWKEERSSTQSRGVHQIDSTDMLAAKMDLILKKLGDTPEIAPVQALDFRAVCGSTGHSGYGRSETQPEGVNFISNNPDFSNGNRPQPGWNSKPHIPSTGQAQLAASSPNVNAGKLPRQPETPPKEHINAVTTRGGKSTQDPPHPRSTPNNAGKEQKKKTTKPEEKDDTESRSGAKEKTAPETFQHEFYDTTVLPFPPRNKRAAADEQYSKFVEVPTYAKYLKDILNNKKPLPSAEIVHMTEECSAAILNQPPQKKKDLGSPTIPCSIGNQVFNQTLCDLGASVSVMPKVVFDKLNHAALAPTTMCLQLADQSIQHPVGIAEDVPVKIWNFLIPVDFVVLDMEIDAKTPLILGRPFLSTADASIDVGAGEVHLNINGMRETFFFKPKVEKCNQVKLSQCQP
ncbi:hypothetical protein U9M48_030514 [Paspalum notatum var. saurae]|uniref:Retrotransposon gag domain-containing protein n=1 Tax=Paspalum notatum var. saurae TaxID=547442 RepID=A0AAQ3U0V6_PASNO